LVPPEHRVARGEATARWRPHHLACVVEPDAAPERAHDPQAELHQRLGELVADDGLRVDRVDAGRAHAHQHVRAARGRVLGARRGDAAHARARARAPVVHGAAHRLGLVLRHPAGAACGAGVRGGNSGTHPQW
jgi:hypothetical protein